MTVETLVAETERLYDNGGCGPEWANTLGFLRTVPFSKHYRTPPKGSSDPEITYAVPTVATSPKKTNTMTSPSPR